MNVLVDGDIVAYRAAYSTEGADLEVAHEKVDELMDDIVFCTTQRDESLEVFLTGKGNFRYDIYPEYKAHRKDTPKPEHLSPVRDYIVKEWNAVVSKGQEADDLIAIRATELDYKCIIVSVDKDFKQVPCRLYNPTKGEWTDLTKHEAMTFFYSQILMGDRADNIIGLQGIGPVKANRALVDCTTEQELYDKVLSMYEGDVGRVTLNGQLLWLRRKEGEVWLPPDQR